MINVKNELIDEKVISADEKRMDSKLMGVMRYSKATWLVHIRTA